MALMTSLVLRPAELTAVEGRNRFDDLPGCAAESDRPRWEEFRRRYHAAQDLDAPADFPLQLDFELNSHCQMRCAFCVHGQETVKKRLLSFETFARVIDEGAEHGLCSIKLNYINEPLLRPDLERFVEYARSRGVLNVYFATNGLLLTRERSETLIDAGVAKVMVSLDATSPETFSLMRRSTRLGDIEENIRGLLAVRERRGVSYPLLRVNFLRTSTNAHEADAFLRRWNGVADMVGFQRQVRLPGVDDDLAGALPLGDGPFRCSFPAKLMVVDVDGQILPCCTFSGRSLAVGNVAEMTVGEAWRGMRRRHLYVTHVNGKGLTNPECAHCVGGCS